MKTDLVTSIVAAIVGTVAAYFICNFIVPKIESFSYTTLDSTLNYDLDEPNIEVFNYRAVNPTVEVYVGNCTGNDCETAIIIDDETDNTTEDNSTEETPEQESGLDEESENGATD